MNWKIIVAGSMLVGFAIASLPLGGTLGWEATKEASAHRWDLSRAQTQAFSFAVSPEEGYRVSYDHVKNALRASPISAIQRESTGPTAGCTTTGGGGIWVTDPPGLGVAGCTHQFHMTAISSTNLDCLSVGGPCATDGLSFNFATFGAFALACNPGGVALADWVTTSNSVVPIVCTLTHIGSSPTIWNFWDGLCVGAVSGVVCLDTF